jgi:hypothetical protein
VVPPNCDSYVRRHEARAHAMLCARLAVQVSDASGRKANRRARAIEKEKSAQSGDRTLAQSSVVSRVRRLFAVET